MSTDSLIDKYLRPSISIDSLVVKYLAFSTVRLLVTFLQRRVTIYALLPLILAYQ